MKKIAFLFPGQGSQYPGMGKDAYGSLDPVRKILDKADTVLNRSLTSIMFNGPDDLLKQTENTQPAIFALSCGLVDALAEKGFKPAVAAGHSLGEYSALYAAGVFSFEDGLRLVQQRGNFIRECSDKHPGTMCAVIGLNEEKLQEVLGQCRIHPLVELVNFNCPGQVVAAGSLPAIDEFEDIAKKMGAMKVIRLSVSGPFHSSFMHDAAVAMKAVLKTAPLKDPVIPVVSNVHAQKTISVSQIIQTTADQIDHSVLWEQSIRAIAGFSVEAFIEIGPGKVLSGLNRRIDKTLKTYNIENTETFNSVLHALQNSVPA